MLPVGFHGTFAAAQDVMGKETAAAELTKTFNSAMQAFQSGDYQTAATNLESVIAKAADSPQLEPVYFTLGASYFNLEQYDKAVETLKKYKEKFPQGARIGDATFCIGQASFMSKNYGEAVAAFSQLESIPQLREQALQYEAAAYKEDGKIDEAIATLEKLVSPDIKSTIGVNGAMTLAGLYADKKEPVKATAMIRKVFQKLDLVDNMVRLNAMAVELGDNLLGDEKPGEAIEAYRNVRSRDDVLRFQAGRVLLAQKKVDANIAAMKANPADAASYVATHARLKDELAKAKKLYEEAQKLPDFMPELLLREGKAWYEWDKKWESIVAFNRLLKKYPQAKEREPALFAMLTAYTDVNQPVRAQQLCDQYLKEFPHERNTDTVAYLLGATALQANDPKGAETYFGRMLESRPDSSLKEDMRFLLANARFAQGKFDEAIRDYKKYLEDFPNGHRVEEAVYRIGAAEVFSGKYEEALGGLGDYLTKYPKGTFASDAKYRVMVCKYAGQLYGDIVTGVPSWRQEFPNDAMEGEVLALLGDALAAQGKTADAIPVYIESYKKATTDEVLNYSLFEASKNMQKLGKWQDVTQLFQEFVNSNPDHLSVVPAMFWIGKSLAHEGKTDEAKQYLVGQLKRYIGDPQREAVEQLLQQLAQLCSKRPRIVAAATPESSPIPPASAAPPASPIVIATPTPLPPYDAVGELAKQLQPLEESANATARARLLYTKAELATIRRKPDEHDKLLAQIGEQFKPEELSPLLLAEAGDYQLARGRLDRAAAFYNQLKDYFPKSNYLDYAFVGLGEIAFANKQYDSALDLFSEAADKLAQSKLKDATIGKAKTLLELGKYDESKKLFEQVATVREWRGESTAYAVYKMGDLEARQGHWAEAIAHYQRVFVLYQRYLPWVAKAYIGSAESFDKLGKRQEAIDHLKEMLRNEKLQKFPETNQAKQMLQEWGAA